jgi:hypothetical protein
VDDGVEILPDGVHQRFALEVQLDVAGLATGPDRGDDGQGKGIPPGLVLASQILDDALLAGIGAGDLVKSLKLSLQVRFGFNIRLQKSGV